jgi:hypothetical protein
MCWKRGFERSSVKGAKSRMSMVSRGRYFDHGLLGICNEERTYPFRSQMDKVEPGEAVWKIRMAPSLGLHQWAKGAQKPYFAVLCHRTYTIENPFSYFPNSFGR